MTTPASDPAAFRRLLVAWFDANARDLPWRRTRDPYAILVSEMMLQQTQVATVIGYFNRWMDRFPSSSHLARAESSEVLHAWQGLGYYSRARNLHQAARDLQTRHAGRFPARSEIIETLPGIGSYTAAAVASFAFDESVPVLDTNVIRALSRLFEYSAPVDNSEGRAFLRARAAELLPAISAGRYNAALMELGALICVSRIPACGICPVRVFCAARAPGTLPVKKARRATLLVEEERALIEHEGRVLLEQQTGARWNGLWCLPPRSAPGGAALVKFKYSITHHRVTLAVFGQQPPAEILASQCWVGKASLDAVPMPSPHRKALGLLGILPQCALT